MRAKRVTIPFFIVLILAGLLGLLPLWVNECAYSGGMGAAYKSCDCLGIEWELYDRTAADGPRKTLCIGIVRSRECYQTMGGPHCLVIVPPLSVFPETRPRVRGAQMRLVSR